MRWHLKHEIYGSKPWAVQEEAMRRAGGRPRFGQWLEQGMGKTALALNEFVDSDGVDINIVIAPNSFKPDWVLAPDEWGLGFIHTGMWPRDPLPDHECALYAVNYEAVRYDPHGRNNGLEQLLGLMRERRCMLTIDESKAIGNPSSNTTRGVLKLAEAAVMVRELNGTPMTESVIDYYGQLRALGELKGWPTKDFRNRYAQMGGFKGRQVHGVKEERKEELGRLLDRVSFRALKADWRKDLPPQTQISLHLEMTDRQWQHYRTMMEEFYVQIEDADTVTADIILTQREKLRQISSCLIKQDDQTHWLEQPKDNPKLRSLLDVLEAGPTKLIVVHMYRESGAMLLDQLTKKGYDPAYLRGGMKPEDIKFQKDKFNKDPSCRVLVGQEVTTARGHTLLGGSGKDRCNRIYFYEQHQGLYWREQMKDRNHRGEQDLECLLYDPVTSPMEQVLVDGLVRKKTQAAMMDDLIKEVRRQHVTGK